MSFGWIELPYAAVIALRNLAYDRGWLPTYRSALPVLCVGNLSVGGNGKTPLVNALLSILIQHGKRPVVLSRGYGGSLKGPHLVSALDDAALVGDEPLMLARKLLVPVVVARKRVLGAQFIEQQSLGDVIILDDGFQHRALERDLDIVCAYVGSDKASKAFLLGKLLPLGRFREPKIKALRRAQVLVFTSRSLLPLEPELLRALSAEIPEHLAVFRSHLLLDQISSLSGEEELTPMPGLRVDAFCALAQPEAFFSSLESLGLVIEQRYELADHAPLTEAFLAQVLSQSSGRPILCSEKDAVKIGSQYRQGIYMVRTSLAIEPVERFLEIVLEKC